MSTSDKVPSVDLVLAKILHMPANFRDLGNVPFSQLLRDSGYTEIGDQVSEADIAAGLAQAPRCILDWMEYSSDKRSSGGWYVTELPDQRYEVGHLSSGAPTRITFANNVAAVAAFIKREIEFLRALV